MGTHVMLDHSNVYRARTRSSGNGERGPLRQTFLERPCTTHALPSKHKRLGIQSTLNDPYIARSRRSRSFYVNARHPTSIFNGNVKQRPSTSDVPTIRTTLMTKETLPVGEEVLRKVTNRNEKRGIDARLMQKTRGKKQTVDSRGVRPPAREMVLSGNVDLITPTLRTVRSCPTTLDTDTDATSSSSGAKIYSKAKSESFTTQRMKRTMTLFSRMSVEARCAINETRKEMGLDDSSDSHSDYVTVLGNISSNATTAKNVTESVKQPADVNESVSDLIIRKTSNQNINIGLPLDTKRQLRTQSTQITSIVDSKHENKINACRQTLPIIGQDTRVDMVYGSPDTEVSSSSECDHSINVQQHRLLKIRKPYTDNLFEITPPGYDSRYTDLKVFTKEEVHDIPNDIKANAVAKCSTWLSKYT